MRKSKKKKQDKVKFTKMCLNMYMPCQGTSGQ